MPRPTELAAVIYSRSYLLAFPQHAFDSSINSAEPFSNIVSEFAKYAAVPSFALDTADMVRDAIIHIVVPSPKPA
jgi:hypothetical protein